MTKPYDPPQTSESPTTCDSCGSRTAFRHVERQRFPYQNGGETTWLTADVPVMKCTNCGVAYSGEEGEEARHDVRKAQERITKAGEKYSPRKEKI